MSRELLVLGLLRSGRSHGYQLTDFLEKRLAYLVDLKKPTAYALLERLRGHGDVRMNTEREGNRPERRVYTVTPQGDEHFFELLRDNLGAYSPPRFTDAIGLYFLHALPVEEARELIRTRLAGIEQRLAEYGPKVSEHRGLPAHVVLDHYVTHLEADRNWLAGLLERLERGEAVPGSRSDVP